MIIQDWLPINKYSRPGRKLESVLGIVIHWPEWPGASAKRVRDYFAVVAKEYRFASAQYCLGLDGEIIECMPKDEIAYHCGSKTYTEQAKQIFGKYAIASNLSPNLVSIGIEVSHTNRFGEMTEATYKSLVAFVSQLCNEYGLDPGLQVLRHYDVVGWKHCPKYFVDNPIAWCQFLQDIEEYAE